MSLLHQELSDKILRAFFNVYNTLGYGFLEKVYENALFIELKSLDVYCERQNQLKFISKVKKLEIIMQI